jgi:hypothetical protein
LVKNVTTQAERLREEAVRVGDEKAVADLDRMAGVGMATPVGGQSAPTDAITCEPPTISIRGSGFL